jgi:type VI secretion system protein ImpC
VDEAASSLMRSILHDIDFKRLEAAWRGLYFLVRRTDTASDLKIFILDLNKDEVSQELRTAEKLSDTATFRWFSSGVGGEAWAAVLGNYSFNASVDDVASLIRIAKIAASSRTPFISHIRPEVIGISSVADNPDPADWNASDQGGKLWAALREQPEVEYLGLIMPRFLGRLPYGASTEPVESISFEEFGPGFSHDDYLWVNGCFLAGVLLGCSFREFEWRFGHRFIEDVGGISPHIYKENGETVFKSCAEVQLTQKAAEHLLELGIMPLVSFKNGDVIRLGRFQSVADPPTVLRGRWAD